MSYNLRIRYDILDDDYEFHFVVFFDNKEDAEYFKNIYDSSNIAKKSKLQSTSTGIWLKDFAENKSNKITKKDMCYKVIEMIDEDSNKLEERRSIDEWYA